MSLYNQVISELERDPRPVQKALTESMLDTIYANGGMLANADTGIGKTLASAITARGALCIVDEDGLSRKVIVATSTLNLCRDLQKEMELVGIDAKILLSHRNFVSQERVDALTYDNPTLEQSLRPLREWKGTIDCYLLEYGRLPDGVREHQICQTVSTRTDCYVEDRLEALNAQVVITTHAMIACDMMQSGLVLKLFDTASTLIVDEADAFIDYLKSFNTANFNIRRELSSAKLLCNSKFRETLENCIETARAHAHIEKSFSSEGRDVSLDILHELNYSLSQTAKKNLTVEDRAYLSEIKDYVAWTIESVERNADVAIGITQVNNEPTISIFNPYFSRLFGSYANNNLSSLIMLSGTLSIDYDIVEGTRWAWRDLKLDRFCEESKLKRGKYSPQKFGELDLNLYRTNVEMYSGDSFKLNQDWLVETAAHINKLQGKVLVITGSYEETQALGKLIRGDVIVHRKGEKLRSAIDGLRTTNRHCTLLSPTAHTGVSILGNDGRSVLTDVVVTRLGFGKPNEILKTIEGSPEFPTSKTIKLRQMERFDSINKVIRRLKQILGRGIRHKDDKVSLHILDKRFPLYGESKGHHTPLRYSIPQRFESEYRHATIVNSSSVEEECDVDFDLIY